MNGGVLAFDVATVTGVAWGVPGGIPELLALDFGGGAVETVYEQATFWLAEFLRTRQPVLAAVERPVPPSGAAGFTNHNTTLVTIGLYGIFVGIIRCKSIPLRQAHISTWRKHFLGVGNLKGPDAKAQSVALCKRLGWKAPDHNAAEAAGIWSWACGELSKRTLFEAADAQERARGMEW